MMQTQNNKLKLRDNKGFSLVELIIVIAIMAVLMAVLAPQLIKYVEKSRVQTDDSAASEILNAVKVALTDEAIYSGIVGDETVTWTGTTGALVNTATDATLNAALQAEIDSVVGDPGIPKSKTRKAQVYTVSIDIVDGIPTTVLVGDGWAAAA